MPMTPNDIIGDETGQAHILIVDDDRRLRELLHRYLSENGFRVTEAQDTTQARARMQGLDFDLLVLDVMMPGESGLDFASDLRRTNPSLSLCVARLPRVPVQLPVQAVRAA